jgi:hypothetical protein
MEARVTSGKRTQAQPLTERLEAYSSDHVRLTDVTLSYPPPVPSSLSIRQKAKSEEGVFVDRVTQPLTCSTARSTL